MDRELFVQALRACKHRTPFKPFTVSMENGNRLEVDRPDALAIRAGQAQFIGPGSLPSIFEHEGVTRVFGVLAGHNAE